MHSNSIALIALEIQNENKNTIDINNGLQLSKVKKKKIKYNNSRNILVEYFLFFFFFLIQKFPIIELSNKFKGTRLNIIFYQNSNLFPRTNYENLENINSSILNSRPVLTIEPNKTVQNSKDLIKYNVEYKNSVSFFFMQKEKYNNQ